MEPLSPKEIALAKHIFRSITEYWGTALGKTKTYEYEELGMSFTIQKSIEKKGDNNYTLYLNNTYDRDILLTIVEVTAEELCNVDYKLSDKDYVPSVVIKFLEGCQDHPFYTFRPAPLISGRKPIEVPHAQWERIYPTDVEFKTLMELQKGFNDFWGFYTEGEEFRRAITNNYIFQIKEIKASDRTKYRLEIVKYLKYNNLKTISSIETNTGDLTNLFVRAYNDDFSTLFQKDLWKLLQGVSHNHTIRGGSGLMEDVLENAYIKSRDSGFTDDYDKDFEPKLYCEQTAWLKALTALSKVSYEYLDEFGYPGLDSAVFASSIKAKALESGIRSSILDEITIYPKYSHECDQEIIISMEKQSAILPKPNDDIGEFYETYFKLFSGIKGLKADLLKLYYTANYLKERYESVPSLPFEEIMRKINVDLSNQLSWLFSGRDLTAHYIVRKDEPYIIVRRRGYFTFGKFWVELPLDYDKIEDGTLLEQVTEINESDNVVDEAFFNELNTELINTITEIRTSPNYGDFNKKVYFPKTLNAFKGIDLSFKKYKRDNQITMDVGFDGASGRFTTVLTGGPTDPIDTKKISWEILTALNKLFKEHFSEAIRSNLNYYVWYPSRIEEIQPDDEDEKEHKLFDFINPLPSNVVQDAVIKTERQRIASDMVFIEDFVRKLKRAVDGEEIPDIKLTDDIYVTIERVLEYNKLFVGYYEMDDEYGKSDTVEITYKAIDDLSEKDYLQISREVCLLMKD